MFNDVNANVESFTPTLAEARASAKALRARARGLTFGRYNGKRNERATEQKDCGQKKEMNEEARTRDNAFCPPLPAQLEAEGEDFFA